LDESKRRPVNEDDIHVLSRKTAIIEEPEKVKENNNKNKELEE